MDQNIIENLMPFCFADVVFFNLQLFLIHSDKPKNTNSAVVYKYKVFTYTI